nr:MAG TPA: hypothetical protein [Caudoviricetes sp.]
MSTLYKKFGYKEPASFKYILEVSCSLVACIGLLTPSQYTRLSDSSPV